MDSQADWCFVCLPCCKFIRGSNAFIRHKRMCFRNFKFCETEQTGSGVKQIRMSKVGPCKKVFGLPLKQSTGSCTSTGVVIKNYDRVKRLDIDETSDSVKRFVHRRLKNDASVSNVLRPIAQETDVKIKADIIEPRPVKTEENSQSNSPVNNFRYSYLKQPRLTVHLQKYRVKTETGIENVWNEISDQRYYKLETEPMTVVVASTIAPVYPVSSRIKDPAVAEVKAEKTREKIQKNHLEANLAFSVETDCVITDDDIRVSDSVREENAGVAYSYSDDKSTSTESSESRNVGSKRSRKPSNPGALSVKFKCPSCPKVFLLESMFKKHVADHDNKFGKLECEICDIKFLSITGKKRHDMRVHAETLELKEQANKHKCSFCGKRITGKRNLTIHIRTHTGEKPYACRFCPKKFVSSESRKLHEKCMHGIDPTFRESFKQVCAICSKKFMNSYLLDLHMRSHTGRKPFSCDFCPKTFSQRAHKKAHALSMHPDEEHLDENGKKLHFHQCSQCPKKFYSKPDFERHVLVHSGEMPFNCRFCPAKFNLAGNQNRHEIDVHYDKLGAEKIANKHKCEWCSKIFYAKSELEQHKGVHRRIRRDFKCEHCGKEYISKNGFMRHFRLSHRGDANRTPLPHTTMSGKYGKENASPSHEDEKEASVTRKYSEKSLQNQVLYQNQNYRCSTCSKKFKDKDCFEKHKLECHAQKLFICRFCPRDSMSKSIRLRHEISIHFEQMNPQELVCLPRCKLCLKYFVYKRSLLLHEKMHATTKKTSIANRSAFILSESILNDS